MSAIATAVAEICKFEGCECTESKTRARVQWFRRFNSGETSLEFQPRSDSRPSTVNIEALSARAAEAATTYRYSQIVVG